MKYPNERWPKSVKAKWDEFNAKYLLSDPLGQELITQFCDGKAQELAAQILVDKHGILVVDPKSGRLLENPACATIRGAVARQRAALRALKLDAEPKGKVGRPPFSR